jgi:AP-4 complex subunit beta-1
MSVASSSSPKNTAQPAAAAGFFVDSKKGEVNELKALLKNMNVERDMKRKRDVLKKVIAYMTLGIDVSRLFTEMIMAIETKDVVVKKMVYLYLSTQAHKEPEMAIMCINSLRRECENEDPMVRGLALRSLSNLRMPSILEYVQDPINKGLSDLSSYVRRVAVMGVLKVYHISPETVENNGWRGQLHDMLQDVDAAVVGNAMCALNEMLLGQGGLPVSAASVMPLLNRVAEFNEWGLIAVLDYISRYKPSGEEETFAIMNLLDPVLRSANSGAVLGVIKCFMNLTDSFPDLRSQVWVRAKPPLLTFITGGTPETQFAVLKHLQLVLPGEAAQGVFDDEYRQFFVRYNEPPHVKHIKVSLLPLVINEGNAMEVSAELSEYVADVDSELARCAISAMGRIALRIPSVAPELASRLVELLEMDVPYIRAASTTQLLALARTYSGVATSLIPHLPLCLKSSSDDDNARAAVIWMLGEYAAQSVEAPYLLEKMISDFSQEPSVAVKLQLLTATTKAYFARPPEVQQMLGRLFKAALNDVTDQDTHDRALLYYRLLRTDIEVARDVLSAPAAPTNYQFIELKSNPQRDALMKEFNTLAVIHGEPSAHFIGDAYQLRLDRVPISDDTFEPQAVVASVADIDYVESGDLLGDFGSPQTSNLVGNNSGELHLQSGASLTATEFQQRWVSMATVFNGELCAVSLQEVTHISASMAAKSVHTVASGGSAGACKMFLYAIQTDLSLLGDAGGDHEYLMQVVIAGDKANAMIKTTSSDVGSGEMMASFLREILGLM